MKYIAIIDADEKPVSCEFIGCNGNVAPYIIGATTNIKALEQEPKKGHWIMTSNYYTGAYGTIDYVKCSCCGEESLVEGNFCPNCGAEMESEE